MHSLEQNDFLLLTVIQVYGQPAPPPNKLEVQLALLRREGLKDAPEALNGLMIFAAVPVLRDAFEFVNLDSLLSTSSSLDSRRGQVGDDVQIAHEHSANARLDGLDLLSGFGATGLEHKVNELLDTVLLYESFLSIVAQDNHVAVR